MELMNTSKQDITLAWGRFYYTFKSEESKEVSQVIYNAALRRYDDDLIDSIEYKKQEAKLKKEEADQKIKSKLKSKKNSDKKSESNSSKVKKNHEDKSGQDIEGEACGRL